VAFWLGRFGKQPELGLKVGRVVEVFVDTRKTDIGDVVKLAKAVEYRQTDLIARNVATDQAKLIFNIGGQFGGSGIIDWPTFGGGLNPGLNLGPNKRNSVA